MPPAFEPSVDAPSWRALARLAFSGDGHDGPPSRHFDGRRFHNENAEDRGSFLSFIRWRMSRRLGRPPPPEPAEEAGIAFGATPPRRIDGNALRTTWINHSTVLIQTAGINILTDPIWSDTAGPTRFAGVKRIRPPGIRFGDLPPIDVVLVSHNHYDHMDLPSLRALARRHSPRFITGLGNAAFLRSEGIASVEELDWWQELDLGAGRRLACVPARHFSSRGFRDRDRTLWCGFTILAPGGPIYFAADTGYGTHFEEILHRFGNPRLALLPIGAYLPRWFMQEVHLSPDEAVRAHKIIGPRTSVAIHFGTFPLADDSPGQAARELKTALACEGLPAEDFRIPGFGEGLDLP